MFRKLLILSFFLILISSLQVRSVSTDCRYCCKRTAVLEEFVNLHNPDFEEKKEEWSKCIDSQLKRMETFTLDDLKNAFKNCEHLEYSGEYMYPISVTSMLVETFTTEYFHMVHRDYQKKKTEYVFKGSYEADIEDGSTISYGSLKGEPCKSRFILELYYNGKYQELVKRWVTEKRINSIPAHYKAMFEDRDAKTREDRPIQEKLLWEFEKIPISCVIKPEKDVVEPDEQISIEITAFKDRKGRNSREFNRIVVQALEGEILNGEKSTFDPGYRVFTVGNGSVTVLYKAPELGEITEDMIYAYNSCDILDTESLPLSETKIKDKIAERKIKIERGGDWKGTVTYKRNISWTDTLPTPSGGTVTYKRKLKEDATVHVTLKYTHSYGTDDYLEEVTITGNYSLSVRMEDRIIDPNQGETRSVKTAQCSGSLGLMSGEGDGGASVSLVVDNKAKTYSLHCDINSPFCSGTEVISGISGPATFPFEWGFAADGVIFEGSTADKTISGSWSMPISGNVMLTQYSGKGSGTSWTWNFTKTGD